MTTGEYKCKRPQTWLGQQQTDMEQWSQWRVPEAGRKDGVYAAAWIQHL